MIAQLEELRSEIDQLSLQILSLLNQRARKVMDIAEVKRGLGLPIRDPHREAQLLEHLASSSDGPLDQATVRALFRGVLDASVALVERQRRHAGLRVGSGGGARVTVTVRGRTIGGADPVYIAGPCSVEDEEQMETAARRLKALGVGFLRAGAYKPRTSPYAFQGLGEPGLRLLAEVAARHDLVTVTEATSVNNVALVAKYADVIQVGTRNMYNYELLRAVGQTGKPVVLKRAFSATLDEWLNAAEYIALSGSESIVLCERGIRTFARETRSTLDLSIVPLALREARLPVLVDVSHAAGRRDILVPLAKAAFAVGAHGVMIEVHPDPDVARSDSEQQLSLEDFAALQGAVQQGLSGLSASLRAGCQPERVPPARPLPVAAPVAMPGSVAMPVMAEVRS